MNITQEAKPPVILVMLRQPVTNDPEESRSDPFWEFGSFGCTRCHTTNLMNPHRIHELDGIAFAFAQGGTNEVRLVHVSPPISTIHNGSFAEVKWEPTKMPLKFETAPVLINNDGFTEFPTLLDFLEDVNRSTWVARFASKFRSRRQVLPWQIGNEVVDTYKQVRNDGAAIAESYVEALPYPPPSIDTNREQTYRSMLES